MTATTTETYDAFDQPTSSGAGLPAKPEDYEEAIILDCWTAREALCWLKGRNPFWVRGDIFAGYPLERDQVQRAVQSGVLDPDSSTPQQWVKWAAGKGWNIPPGLAHLVSPASLSPINSPTQRETKPSELLASPPEVNEPVLSEFSINTPKTKDDWFKAIRDTAKRMYSEQGHMPDETAVWIRLLSSPPVDAINYNQSHKTLSYNHRSLTRGSFKKRFYRYFPKPVG